MGSLPVALPGKPLVVTFQDIFISILYFFCLCILFHFILYSWMEGVHLLLDVLGCFPGYIVALLSRCNASNDYAYFTRWTIFMHFEMRNHLKQLWKATLLGFPRMYGQQPVHLKHWILGHWRGVVVSHLFHAHLLAFSASSYAFM